MQQQTQGRSAPRSDPKLRTEYDNGKIRVVLTNARFYCHRCEKWKPASKFGQLRFVNGVIRNQSCCKDCR